MKLRKLLLGVGITAFALFVSAGFGTGSAKAMQMAEVEGITVDYASQEILIGKSSDIAKKNNKLYVTVCEYKDDVDVKEGGKVEYYKIKKKQVEYDVKDEEQIAIDMSSLPTGKSWSFYIKGDVDTKAVMLNTYSATDRISASIDYTKPDDPRLVLKDLRRVDGAEVKEGYIEYAVGNSNKWNRYFSKNITITDTDEQENIGEKTDLTGFQKFGATLRTRIRASSHILVKEVSSDTDVTFDRVTSVKCSRYEVEGSGATKEVKVKIAKLATGPRVSVNYAKNTISIPKTAEYRTKVGEEFDNKLVKASTKKAVVVPISDFQLSDAATIDVRTMAKVNTKDVTKSKPSSHITEVAIPKIEELSVKLAADGEGEAADIDKDNFGTADLEKITANGKVTFKYGTKSGTATLTSTDTDNVYEVYVTGDTTVGVVGDKLVTPVSTVKGIKKLTTAKALKLTKLKDGDKIFIRKAGNAKNKVFASEFAAFGTVKFPTATPAPTVSTGA